MAGKGIISYSKRWIEVKHEVRFAYQFLTSHQIFALMTVLESPVAFWMKFQAFI